MSMDTNTIKKEIDSIVKMKVDFSYVLNFVTGFYSDDKQLLKWAAEKQVCFMKYRTNLIANFLFFRTLHCNISFQNYKLVHYNNLAELGPMKDADPRLKKSYLTSLKQQVCVGCVSLCCFIYFGTR